MKHVSYIAVAMLVLSACNKIPADAYFNRGNPYSLLDSSSEVVNVPLSSETSIDELVQWIDQDQPSSAELICLDGDPVCTKAMETLEMFSVPVQFTSAADNNVVLTYDRVVARDCENRYVDNPINPYNLNHPTFGCSMAVNILQQVGDKRQFTSPALLDYRDGEKAAQDYKLYLRPYDNAQVNTFFSGEQASSSSVGGTTN